MESLVHPSELSVWHRFLQARRLHRETSRSKNRDWYRPALELDTQLHLFVEGDKIQTARLRTTSNDTWTEVDAPPMSVEGDDLTNFLQEFRKTHLGSKVKSLGVILHLADEFAISELAPFHEPPEDLGVVRDQLFFTPAEVLEDQSVSDDDLSFRLFPYTGLANPTVPGAAITISKQHQEFLQRMRAFGDECKIPVRTVALSAPLVALASLPHMVKDAPGRPFCVFFSYSSFSVLGFFKANGDLLMLRSVRHHAGGVPANVDVIIQTMAVALELADPVVIILALSQDPASRPPRLANAVVFDWSQHCEFEADLPLEFQGASGGKLEPGAKESIGGSQTFQELEVNGWAVQDFLPPSQEELDLCPGQIEMKLMRFGGMAIKAVAVLMVLLALWTGIRAVQIMRDPAWHSDTAGASSGGLDILTTKIKRFEKWNTFLADRSKGWVTMELFNQLCPNANSMVIQQALYTVRPDAIRDQANVSMVREWTVHGLANRDALDGLQRINSREGVRELFKHISDLTGDTSMDPDAASRHLNVNLLLSENKRYDPKKGTTAVSRFPVVFSLTISQRIPLDDPLAIPAAAAA